jgi:hypothetical protein
MTADQIFEKKKECGQYLEKIVNDWVSTLGIKEIFYSPIENTCMYVFQDDNIYYIYDILSSKEIFSIWSAFTTCWGIQKLFSEEFDNCKKPILEKFNGKIKELKWE